MQCGRWPGPKPTAIEAAVLGGDAFLCPWGQVLTTSVVESTVTCIARLQFLASMACRQPGSFYVYGSCKLQQCGVSKSWEHVGLKAFLSCAGGRAWRRHAGASSWYRSAASSLILMFEVQHIFGLVHTRLSMAEHDDEALGIQKVASVGRTSN